MYVELNNVPDLFFRYVVHNRPCQLERDWYMLEEKKRFVLQYVCDKCDSRRTRDSKQPERNLLSLTEF